MVEQESFEELPIDEAQKENHDLLEKLEKQENEKLKSIEEDRWYEEEEKKDSSFYAPYDKLSKKI